MSKEKYFLKLELYEVPKFVSGNYSGKFDVSTEVRGASKEQIREQLEVLLGLFYEPWQRPRDSRGHFIKAKPSEEKS